MSAGWKAIVLGGLTMGTGMVITVRNHSGTALVVTREAGRGDRPLEVHGYCASRDHQLCPCSREPRDFGWRLQGDGGLPAAGRPEFEYLLEPGDAATFNLEHPSGETYGMLTVTRMEGAEATSFGGLLIYAYPSVPPP